MGKLSWGQRLSDVVGVLIKRIEATRDETLKNTPGWGPKSKVRKAAQERMRNLRSSYVKFDGDPTPHDRVLGDHIAHHNDESALVDKGPEGIDYYIFHDEKLWKWVRVLGTDGNGGPSSFTALSKGMQRRFGRGRSKRGPLEEGGGLHRWLEWKHGPTRVRAFDKNQAGAFAVVFEHQGKAQQLAKARQAAKRQKTEKVASKPSSRFGNRRSVMEKTEEAPEQSAAQRRARARREQERRDQAQREIRKRREQKKRNRVLNSLDKLDDSDPIGGIGQ